MISTRRQFLRAAGLSAAGLCVGPVARAAEPGSLPRPYRAAVVGRTGGGDYGHGYDQIFNGLANVSVQAVADADPTGLKQAAARAGARQQYTDYRVMLREVKPDLVAIAPRQPDCHRDMALAAIEVCRGLFMEKPITETLEDADAILAAAQARRVPIQVAHNRRYTADFVQVKALLDQGLIGEIRQVQIHGKQDARAGGEDLIVLGTHDFDLMRFYFGDPVWCQATVRQDGRDITRTDIHRGREPMLVAGNSIHALFAFPRDVMVHWSSLKRGDHWNTSFGGREKWAFEILGTKGILAQQAGPGFLWLDSPFFAQPSGAANWKPLPTPANWDWPEHARHPIKSLIHALETGASPVCSGEDARWTIEMVAAVYESQRTRSRVEFPLSDRRNPLTRF